MKHQNTTIYSGAAAFLVLGFALILSGCKNDEETEEPPLQPVACEVPDYLYHHSYIPIIDTLSIGPACVNPNNPDEILFYHRGTYSIYYFNRIDSNFLLVHDYISEFDHPKWHENEMALVNVSNRTQFFGPLEDNYGDTWLSFSTQAAWGADPSMAVYNTTTTFSSPTSYTVIGPVTDNSIRDTLNTWLEHDRAWVTPDTIFSGGSVYTISDDHLETIVNTHGHTYVSAIDQTQFYAMDLNTLYRIDALNGQYEVVGEYSNCEGYSHIQYHAGMDKIFAMRTYRSTFEGTNALIERSDLVWLNMDGSVFEVIDLTSLLFTE